jgi:hypothetical protein
MAGVHPITNIPYSINGGLINEDNLDQQARDLIGTYRVRGESLDAATARELVLGPLRRAEAERVGKLKARAYVRQRVDLMPMRKPLPLRQVLGDIPADIPSGLVRDAIGDLIRDKTLEADGIADGRTMTRVRS